jgi:hypothetical protein
VTLPEDDRSRIRPEYTRGDLVRVARGRQQPEAELIQNLLREEGVPSTLRRSPGFDVPEMLAAGPRDVLVPASGADVAREVLLQSGLVGGPVEGPSPLRLLAGLLLAVALVAAIVFGVDAL